MTMSFKEIIALSKKDSLEDDNNIMKVVYKGVLVEIIYKCINYIEDFYDFKN